MLNIITGILSSIIGAILWSTQKKTVLNSYVWVSIFLICAGASSLLRGIHFVSIRPKDRVVDLDIDYPPWLIKGFIILLIYIGTLAYTIASYYHLRFKEWTFLKAFLIAIPFIFIEYQFSIRGNYYASSLLGMNTVQIALLTMTFYFINSWLMNYLVMDKTVVWWRELLAFLFIGGAFLVTTTL